MAGKRKNTKKTEKQEQVMTEQEQTIEEETVAPAKEEIKIEEKPKKEKEIAPVIEKTHKFDIGDIVYVSKDADADLNGFKLFPQYKKYTYTVEAYDEISGVYSLRRLNLLLNLKERFIMSPDERAHDSLNRKQF